MCSGHRVVGVSGSPSFHAGSLVTELQFTESCAASAALHSVSDSQLTWCEDLRQTSSPLIGTTGNRLPSWLLAATTGCCIVDPCACSTRLSPPNKTLGRAFLPLHALHVERLGDGNRLTCTAHLPLNAGWMPRSSAHILLETTMCLLRQSGAPQRAATPL